MFGTDPIEQIRLAVKELDAEDRHEWSDAARSDQLVELLEVMERLQAEAVRAVGEWDAHTDWALDGALSPRSWLTHRAPISGVGASRMVGMARVARGCAGRHLRWLPQRHRPGDRARQSERDHGPRHVDRFTARGSASGALRARRLWPHPLATAFRLACDCSVTRVLMRGQSEVLDLGRSTRLASAALHKALAIRDRGCVFPGCDRPPAWCNAHHLVWWEHGGPTNEQNLCLLCRRHHTLCHEGGWSLTRNHDGTYQAHEPPAGHVPTRRRGRAPPAAA